MEEAQVKFQDIVVMIKSKWLIILVISLFITTIVAIVNYFMISPQYDASTKLFIGQEDKDGTYSTDMGMYQKLLKTYSEIILTNDLIDKAIKSNNLNVSVDEVMNDITVTPSSNTQILYIQYTSTDKFLARDVINGITEEFIKESHEYMPNSRIKVMEHVELPKQAVAYSKMKNILVGFVAGIIIGIGLLIFVEYMDDTFKNKEEIERITGIEVIGVISSKSQE